MLTDSRKSITTPILYDRRNLPVSVTKSGTTYQYSYDDAGQRIYKQTNSANKEYYLRDHTGKELAIYDWVSGSLKMVNLYGNGLIGKVNVIYSGIGYGEGTIRTDSRQYYIKDHLGSIRQVYDETATIVSAQDYYSYGEVLRSYVTAVTLTISISLQKKNETPKPIMITLVHVTMTVNLVDGCKWIR
jgi:YD repeat-containing protein